MPGLRGPAAAGGQDEPQTDPASSSSSNKQVDSENVQLAGVIEPAAPNEAQPSGPVGKVAQSIVARVNGDVILAREVLDPIQDSLYQAQQTMPPDKFAQYRRQAIRQQLRSLIERAVLIQEARRVLPEASIQHLEGLASNDFRKRIEEQMAKMHVGTEEELRNKLAETGQSLEQLERVHRDTFIAQQFLRMQLAPRLAVSRQDMLDYYNMHREQFQRPGGVRWSEILVSFDKHGSREAARAKAEQIVDQLRSGADFAELARAESDGATAFQGGKWDLTTKGSYIVPAVDQALFSLPLHTISDPIEGPRGWHIVRVDQRVKPGRISFLDAQDQILQKLREQRFLEESNKYLEELISKAHISTVFDDAPNSAAASTPSNG